VGEDLEGFRAYASARRSDLRRTAYLICGDWYLADDLVQDALARLFVRWRRIRAKGDVDPYVRRMLVNGYLATHRRASRREVATTEVPDAPARADGDDGTRDLLLRALAELQPSQRTIVVLRYWDDLSVEQTAAVLGCSTGNVKSQAARGLSHLRAALSSVVATEGGPR
jgi:RNA polymerase sigma-70 factor (sigma-E family)